MNHVILGPIGGLNSEYWMLISKADLDLTSAVVNTYQDRTGWEAKGLWGSLFQQLLFLPEPDRKYKNWHWGEKLQKYVVQPEAGQIHRSHTNLDGDKGWLC